MVDLNSHPRQKSTTIHNILLISSLVVLTGMCVFTLDLRPSPVFEDDAFYYWVSALRTISYGFPTFDGYEPTNGFHWLWYAILTCFAYIAAKLGVSALTAKALILLTPSLAIWAIIFRNTHVLLMFLALISALFVGFTMETALAGLCLGIGLKKILEGNSPAKWLTLAMLARVDVIMSVLIILPFVKRKDSTLLILGMIMAICASLGVNYLLVDEFFSVSSELKAANAVKSIESYLFNIWINVASMGNMYRYLIVVSLNVLLIALHIKYEKNHRTFTFFAAVLAANSFLVAHTLLSHLRDWYFAPTIISLLVLSSSYVPLVADNLRTKLALLSSGIAGVGVVLLIAYAVTLYPAWMVSKKFYREACEILDGERVFSYDASGRLAWTLYGCANITNGDGLVNSHKYLQDVVAPKRFAEYIQDNDIKFYITNKEADYYNCPMPPSCFAQSQVVLRLQSDGGSRWTRYQLVEVNPKP